MVPFMFTVKNMNIEGKADGLTGEFLVPSYREFPGRLGVKSTKNALLSNRVAGVKQSKNAFLSNQTP